MALSSMRLVPDLVQVGNGGSHRALDHIPCILSLLEACVKLCPCLLKVLELIPWPIVVEGVHCLDVVQNDLVGWVNVFVAVQIIGTIQEATCVMPKVGGHGLS